MNTRQGYLLAEVLLDGVMDDENEWEASIFIATVIYPAYSLYSAAVTVCVAD